MKLKQLFCIHKKLTAVGIYEKPKCYDVWTCPIPFVICKCNKCAKEFEYSGRNLDLLRHEFRKEINVDNVVNHELLGKWW